MKICIIIPTYNEKDNVADLLEKIFLVISKIKQHKMHILVVDDKSPDGTANIVRKIMKKRRNLHILQGEKRGLGIAYIRGFDYCMKNGFELVFEMDADFSHNPDDIPRFIEEIEKGNEIVIGSRYVSGGKIAEWNLLRRLASKAGNFFSSQIAGIPDIKDCTSGFRAIKTGMLRQSDLQKLDSLGYSFQMELLYILSKKGAKIKEIPITFIDRKKGKTKLGPNDILEFLINAFRLRLNL